MFFNFLRRLSRAAARSLAPEGFVEGDKISLTSVLKENTVVNEPSLAYSFLSLSGIRQSYCIQTAQSPNQQPTVCFNFLLS
jgi:hypothetical protein